MGRARTVDVIGGFHFTTAPAESRDGMTFPGLDYTAMGTNQTYSGAAATTALSNISLEMWVRPRSLPAAGSTIISHGVPASNGYEIEWQANWTWRVFLGGVGNLATAARALIHEQWNHVVILRQTTQWDYYLNGLLINSSAGTAAPTAPTVMQLGAATSAQQDLRDVAVYTVALSRDQVLKHFLFGQGTPIILNAAQEFTGAHVDPPFVTVGVTSFEPDVEGPPELDAPFLTVDVDPFAPSILGHIEPPFVTVGFFAGPVQPGTEPPGTPVPVQPVTLFEGALPPFVPPSLPPTLGGGAGPGGGGGTIPPTGPGVPLPPLSSGGLAGIRFYQGPPWRWVVTNLDSETLTFLDRLAFEAEVKYLLDRTSQAKLSVPADNPEVNILDVDGFPFVDEGDRLLYGFRREGGTGEAGRLWVCRFAGTIMQTEDTGLTEDARTILTAVDPWQRLYQRPMVNIDGEFPDEAGFFSFNDTQVGVIALTFLRNTILNHGEVGIDMGDATPAWSEDLDGNPVQLPGTSTWGGPYGQLWGAVRYKSEYETTTQVDMAFQQGMSVGEVWDQLIQTGLLDIVLTPIYDPINRPGYTHEVSIYARVGDPANDAIMAWDKPSRNLVRINHIKDGFKRANTVRYHEHQGGPPVAGGIPISYGPSILRYGEYWATQFFPGRIEAAALAFAELQLELRANGIDTVQIEPTSERAPFLFTEWFLGDTVPIYASDKLREAIAGFQRIYGVTVRIDENSYERLPMVAGSPDEA